MPTAPTPVPSTGSPVVQRPTNAVIGYVINAPTSFAVAEDSAGNVYFTDGYVFKVAAGASTRTTFAGSGSSTADNVLATQAAVNAVGLQVNNNNELLIASYSDNKIRKVNLVSNIITTVFGTGASGYSGDGGKATSATTSLPWGVWSNSLGWIYFGANNAAYSVIRMIDASGIVSAVAGSAVSSGFSGDGGPATAALMNKPWRVSGDSAGNLFISDLNNARIRRVSSGTGIISTYAGTGSAGYSGEGLRATASSLSTPDDNKVDTVSGDVYVSSYGSNRVQVVKAGSQVMNTFAGNGANGHSGDGGAASAASLGGPYGLYISNAASTFTLYIAEYNTNWVRTVKLT